jgi:cytochrome oxidase assembly protein ShyY1
MTTEKKMYGWFSEKAAKISNVNLYESASGGTVEVTCITSDPEGCSYMWEDKKPVGEVLRHVRTVRQNSAGGMFQP